MYLLNIKNKKIKDNNIFKEYEKFTTTKKLNILRRKKNIKIKICEFQNFDIFNIQ